MLALVCRSLIPLALFGLIITGCNKSTESGSGKVVSNQPVDTTPGVRTYRVDPAIGGTLSAAGVLSADPKFANASLVIPPGSLSIPVEIALFEAQSLVNPSTISSIGATNLTPAGPAVGILPSQSVSVMNPMSIALPYSVQTALTGGVQVGVIAIYPGQSKNELETFVGSELDFGTSGVVKLSISRFGAFQLVYSDGSLTKVKSDTDAAISQTISGATVAGSPGGNGASKMIFDAPIFDGEIPTNYKYVYDYRNAVIGDNKILLPNSHKQPGSDDSDSSHRPRLTMIDSQGQLVAQFGSGGHVVINNELIPSGFGVVAAVDNEHQRIYFGGESAGQSRGFVAAMNFKGELISTFGINGIVKFPMGVAQVEVLAGRIYVGYYNGIDRLYLDGVKDTSFNAGAAGRNFVIEGQSVFVADSMVYFNPYHEDAKVSKLNLATGALQGSKIIDMPGSRETGQLIFAHGGFLYLTSRSTKSDSTTITEDNNLVVKLRTNLEPDASFASGGLAKKSGLGGCSGMVGLASDKLLFTCWGTPWLLSTTGSTLDIGNLARNFETSYGLSLVHAGKRFVGIGNRSAVINENPFWSCQSSYESERESCFNPNSEDVIATKSRTCNATKKGFDYGACTPVDLGTPKICTPSSSSSVSCIGESIGSTVATKTKSCVSDGLSYTYGVCVATSCAPGYYLDTATKTCIPQICAPSTTQTPEDCRDSIPNSANATRTKFCNATGSGFNFGSACTLSSCVIGYVKVNNSCSQQICTPLAPSGTGDCSAEKLNSAAANGSRSCNSQGTGFVFDNCNVTSCLSGYNLINNSCQPQICSPGVNGPNVSCTASVWGALLAQKTSVCNSDGSGYNYGTCVIKMCQSGLTYFPPDNIDPGGRCSSYSCTPNTVSYTQSCTSAEILLMSSPWAQTATKTRTCNSAGNGLVDSACSVTSCEAGFNVVNGACQGISYAISPPNFSPFATVGSIGQGADGADYALTGSGACYRVTRDGSNVVSKCVHNAKLFMQGAFIATLTGANLELWQLNGSLVRSDCGELTCARSMQGNVQCTSQNGAANPVSFSTGYLP